MNAYFDQHQYDVKLEWGVQGLKATARACECIVVVDMMSFSTCMSIATARGAMILPFPWKDERALSYGEVPACKRSWMRDNGSSIVSARLQRSPEVPR